MITDDTTPAHLKKPGQKLQHSRQLGCQHAKLGESWGRTPCTLLTAPEHQSLKMSFVRALKPRCISASSSASPTVMTQNPVSTAGCTHWVWVLPAPLARHSPAIKDRVISLCVICGKPCCLEWHILGLISNEDSPLSKAWSRFACFVLFRSILAINYFSCKQES